MLTKQSWKLIKFPNSLLAKVLLGRYFKIGHFLKATLGSNPSYTWRSIIWGRELFKHGYRWKGGNGLNIDASKDPWILKEGATKSILTHPDIRNFIVAQLKDPNGKWNEPLILSSYMDVDATTILNIPTRNNMGDDEIIWNLDPKGKFSVKSVYRLRS